MQESERRYIDVYVGIGIVLLVLGYSEVMPEAFKIVVEAFGLPLFFTAAGVYGRVFGMSEQSMPEFFKKSASKIMIPYCWMGLLAVTGHCVGMFLAPTQFTRADAVDMIWDMLSLYGGSLLWFLPVFFIGVAGYRAVRRKLFYPVALILTAILAAVICGINGIPVYLYGKEMSAEVFLLQIVYTIWRGCVGMFFCAVGEGLAMLLDYLCRKKLVMILSGLALTGVGIFLALMNQEKAGVTISFRYLLTGEMAFYFLAAICFCSGLLFLCRWINECRPLEYLGKSSLIVLATCLDFKVMALAALAGNKIFAVFDHDFLRNTVTLVVITAMELLLIWLFRGYLSFMFGKSRGMADSYRKE